jgi:hypothetical protein
MQCGSSCEIYLTLLSPALAPWMYTSVFVYTSTISNPARGHTVLPVAIRPLRPKSGFFMKDWI